jgi:hypothetical protein
MWSIIFLIDLETFSCYSDYQQKVQKVENSSPLLQYHLAIIHEVLTYSTEREMNINLLDTLHHKSL